MAWPMASSGFTPAAMAASRASGIAVDRKRRVGSLRPLFSRFFGGEGGEFCLLLAVVAFFCFLFVFLSFLGGWELLCHPGVALKMDLRQQNDCNGL